MLLYGVVLILTLFFLPRGIVPTVRDRLRAS
jgi:ABC-type branched-subunit amino acid transport system permease subunit